MTRDAVHLPPPSGDLRLGDFDFELPAELIAQHPAAERSGSRLLDGTGRAVRGPRLPRAPRPAAARRPAGLQRHARDQGAAVRRQGHGRRRRGAGRARAAARRGLGPHPREQVAPAGHHADASATPPPARPSRCRCSAAAAPTTRCSTCAFPATSSRCSSSMATCRCRPTSPTPTRPTTCGATRPSSPTAPAPSPRPPPRCISTRRCSPSIAARGVQPARVTLHVGAGTFQPVRSDDLARAQDAHRVVRRAAGDGRRRAAHARRGRARRRDRHHHRARAGVGRRRGAQAGRGHAAGRRGRDAHLHHAGLPLPGGRPAGDQLPPAQEHADDAGERVLGHGAHPRALRARDRAALPLLQLRRRDAAGTRSSR